VGEVAARIQPSSPRKRTLRLREDWRDDRLPEMGDDTACFQGLLRQAQPQTTWKVTCNMIDISILDLCLLHSFRDPYCFSRIQRRRRDEHVTWQSGRNPPCPALHRPGSPSKACPQPHLRYFKVPDIIIYTANCITLPQSTRVTSGPY
jgi:hypothetical protein